MIPLRSNQVTYKNKMKILNQFNKSQLSILWRQFYPTKKLDPIIKNSTNMMKEMILKQAPGRVVNTKGSKVVMNILEKIDEEPPKNKIKSTSLKRPSGKVIKLPGLLSTDKKKYSYKYINITPDGDCFYNSVITALGLKISARQLRNKLSKKVTNKDVFRRITAPFGTSESWAETEEIQAVANMYNVCFIIWMEAFDTWQVIYNDPQPKPDEMGTESCTNIVYLYNSGVRPLSEFNLQNVGGKHFDVLELINKNII